MGQVLRRIGAVVRNVGAGTDAGPIARRGLLGVERMRQRPSDPPELPWADAGPAQPGRIYPSADDAVYAAINEATINKRGRSLSTW